MPELNPLLVQCPVIQYYFVDKTLGTPLAGGIVTFYSDVDRTVLKPVYELQQAPNNTYIYNQLANPLQLSSVGTFLDENGNDIVIYMYPYQGYPTDAVPSGIAELYYFTVTDSNGVLQFSREAYPGPVADSNPASSFEPTENLLSNPQFALVNFTPSSYTYNVSGSSVVSNLAPDWSLITNGTGTVTIMQVAATADIPSNAPYWLDIVSAGLSGPLLIRQRLYHSPRLLENGFVSGYFVAACPTAAAIPLSLTFVPSNGLTSSYTIASGSTTTDLGFNSISGVVKITENNPDSGAVGYVDIILNIPQNTHVQITSIQICGVENSTSGLGWIETPVPRQIDHLFNYYNPLLQFKPIPSMLTGWDFPLNPAQFGSTKTVTTTPAYIWDQTIMASATNNVNITKGSTGAMVATTTGNNEGFYILQYLEGYEAVQTTLSNLSSQITAYGVNASNVTMNVYLFYSAGTGIPTLPTSLGTISTAGVFTLTIGGTWAPITTTVATTTILPLNTVNFPFNINLWNGKANIATGVGVFGMVVSFGAPTSGTTISINYVSLNQGDIATRPAPQTFDEVLRECEYYYEKSYNNTDIPGTTITATGVKYAINEIFNAATPQDTLYLQSFSQDFATSKRTNPLITFYSPTSASPNLLNAGMLRNGAYLPAATGTNPNNYAIPGTSPINYTVTASQKTVRCLCLTTSTLQASVASGNSDPGDEGAMLYHYVADARLGVV